MGKIHGNGWVGYNNTIVTWIALSFFPDLLYFTNIQRGHGNERGFTGREHLKNVCWRFWNLNLILEFKFKKIKFKLKKIKLYKKFWHYFNGKCFWGELKSKYPPTVLCPLFLLSSSHKFLQLQRFVYR